MIGVLLVLPFGSGFPKTFWAGFDTAPLLKNQTTPISISVKPLKHFNQTLFLIALLKLLSMISEFLHLNG